MFREKGQDSAVKQIFVFAAVHRFQVLVPRMCHDLVLQH